MTRARQVTFHWQDTVLDVVYLPPGEMIARGPIDVLVDAERVEQDGLVVRSAPVEKAEKPRRTRAVDWETARVFAMSVLAHAFFVAFAWVTPSAQPFGLASLSRVRPMMRVFEYRPPAPPPKRADLAGVLDAGRHRDPEGRFGTERNDRDAASSRRARGKSDREIALSTGLLGALDKSGGLGGLLGSGGLGTGINDAIGGLRGAAFGDAGGVGGLGSRGSDGGGGGRSIGIGGIGVGGGRGHRGGADIDLNGRGKHRRPPVRVGGKVILSDGLDMASVRRIMHRNLARFRYCYEKELNANPNLRGRVGLQFKILPTGSVAAARIEESSLGSSAVERCVMKVVRTLEFPKPKGGGVVIVRYPFMMDAI